MYSCVTEKYSKLRPSEVDNIKKKKDNWLICILFLVIISAREGQWGGGKGVQREKSERRGISGRIC